MKTAKSGWRTRVASSLFLIVAVIPVSGRCGEGAILPWADGSGADGELKAIMVLRDGLDEVRVTKSAGAVVRTLEGDGIRAVSSAADGWVYGVTAEALRRTNEALWSEGRWEHVCGVPREGIAFADVACDPVSDRVVVSIASIPAADAETGETAYVSPLHLLEKGETELRPVFCRRVGRVHGLAFAAAGELFFGYGGDLWRGQITKTEEQDRVLFGQRLAPLATFETAVGNQSQQGVSLVAVGAGHVWAHVGRMGGSGSGSIVRLPVPPPMNELEGGWFDTEDGPEERYAIYRKMLGEARVVADIGQPRSSGLCAAIDGRTVLYRDRAQWENAVLRVVSAEGVREVAFSGEETGE